MSDNWTVYFTYESIVIDGKNVKRYRYKDHRVTTLPSNLPMPPTDTFSYMFSGCILLQDISALANWDVSNVNSMSRMFYDCRQLQDISALANWDVSNVNSMSSMFSGCILLPRRLQVDASYMDPYLSKYRHTLFRQETKQQITALQKENAELKARLAFLEEKMDFIMSQFSAPVKRQADYELPQWNP